MGAGSLAVGGLSGLFGVNLAWLKANEERTAGRGAGGRDRRIPKEGGSHEKAILDDGDMCESYNLERGSIHR